MNGSVWQAIDVAVVGKPIRCHVGDVELFAKVWRAGKFQVVFGFVGEVPDEVCQFFGGGCSVTSENTGWVG